jgi:phosphoribosylformylglycinamidine cyclo-ligase
MNQHIDGTLMSENGGASYKAAGVDIAAGETLVSRIAPTAKATARAGVMGGLGGFGAAFDLNAAGFVDPILVAATDGVGTKLLIAEASGKHDEIGIDLVAMCVNDLAAQGAEPLFFLDYFATGKLDVNQAAQVITGVAEGCRLAGCALVGGETAEMPGVYPVGRYDVAGFAVGAVERGGFIDGTAAQAGDVAIAIPSAGVHSNGFSLVRRVVRQAGLDWDSPCPFADGLSLGAALLTPTRIYVPAMVALAKGGLAKGFAHITGGGLLENPQRAFDQQLALELDVGTVPALPVFDWLQAAGNIAADEMALTFNCGIGMLIYVAENKTEAALKILAENGAADAVLAGKLVERGDGDSVRLTGHDRWRG